MDSSSDDTARKRHSRHGSSGRAPIIRRSTRGPLDINETPIGIPSPLNPSSSMAASQLLSPTSGNPSLSLRSPALRSPQMRSPRMQSPTGRGSPGPGRFPRSPSGLSSGAATERDFTGLLRPEIYHPLPHLDIPTPFRSSSQQPSPSTPLSTLLTSGHFRPAAIAAASQLTSANPPISPSDHATIFSLLYIRLSCLCLCGNTTLAAQEVLALEDLNSAYYRDDATGMHLVPWELRVLAVRLQGMGFNDARRGVMGYYDLGREARAIVARRKMKAKAESISQEDKEKFSVEIKLWETRLADLGIRVAGALIEMEDLEGAAHFLSTLKPSPNESGAADLAIRKALLWLCLGDVGAARGCVKGLNGWNGEKIVEALALMADGEYEDAVTVWKDLVESGEGKASEKAMWASNLAVALLYCGRLEEAKPLLESQVDAGHAFHALTFNLSTVYELCTERSRALKMGLAEKVASAEKVEGGSITGWEKVNADFKL